MVVVQSHLFVSNTTLVAPMIPHDRRSAFTETSIDVRVGDGGYIVLIGELAVIETRHLQRPVSSLREHEDAIRRVLDRLFTGFCAYDFRWTAKSARSSSAARQPDAGRADKAALARSA